MKRILVLNPNTSKLMTKEIEEASRNVSSPDTEVIVACPNFGPESIESYYESSLATIGLFEKIKEYKDKIDGTVIACYGDPGLYSLKEVFDFPIIGEAEASLSIASLLGHKFSILSALKKATPMFENMVNQYGFSDKLASIEPIELPVLELKKDEDKTIKKLIEVGERARDVGAEVLILGCSGMSRFKSEVEKDIGLPVIDPVKSAVKITEILIDLDLKQSKIGLYKKPTKKPIKGKMKGLFEDFIN